MSRRRGIVNDPTGRLAIREDERLTKAIGTLNPREISVITLRFGLEDGQPKTLDEIGMIYGVTRVRVQQILDKAIAKLRETASDLVVLTHGDHGERVDVIDVIGTPVPLSESERRYYLGRAPNTVSCGYCTREFENGFVMGNGRVEERWGRPRRYCSNKCRQAAYRLRQARARSQHQL